MDDLSSEILLSIFKNLNSVEMINVMPVCRKWLGIIDDNKSLWRRLILPYKENGWNPVPPLTIFDQKSESGLKQVTMKMKRLSDAELTAFRELLERSKGTLEIIKIGNCFNPFLIDLSWKCSNLIDFRIVNSNKMRIELLGDLESEGDGSSKLKILWLPERCDILFTSHLLLLVNLVSLSVGGYLKFEIWRRILEVCGGNLKHLKMAVDLPDQTLQILPIELPRLKALDYDCRTFTRLADRTPYWLQAPLISFLRTNESFPPSPCVSTLSHTGHPEMNQIENNYPVLVELMQTVRRGSIFRPDTDWDMLLTILQCRKINVETGMEVDGVKMILLKRVVVFIANWSGQRIDVTEAKLAQLRLLVDEVEAVDAHTTIPIVEVDI